MPTIPVLAFLTLRLPSGHVGFGFKRWSLLAVSPIFIIIFASVLHLMRCSRGHHCVCTLFTAIVMICCRHTEIFVWLCHMNFKFKARSVGISLDTSGPELFRGLTIIRTRTLGFRFVSFRKSHQSGDRKVLITCVKLTPQMRLELTETPAILRYI